MLFQFNPNFYFLKKSQGQRRGGTKTKKNMKKEIFSKIKNRNPEMQETSRRGLQSQINSINKYRVMDEKINEDYFFHLFNLILGKEVPVDQELLINWIPHCPIPRDKWDKEEISFTWEGYSFIGQKMFSLNFFENIVKKPRSKEEKNKEYQELLFFVNNFSNDPMGSFEKFINDNQLTYYIRPIDCHGRSCLGGHVSIKMKHEDAIDIFIECVRRGIFCLKEHGLAPEFDDTSIKWSDSYWDEFKRDRD